MKLRPFQLSQIEMGGFSLAGYSVAGEETCLLAPELDCTFDIGRCPREALPINHVLLSHGHADHVAGITYYFAQRDFQGIAGGKALVPANLVGPLESLMAAWGRVEGHIPPFEFIGMTPGDDYEIRRGLLARAFGVPHVQGSLGYALVDVRQKLKPEFDGLTGPQLVELKGKGVTITNTVEVPLVAYLGDTGRMKLADIPAAGNAKVLLLECTFFDDDHIRRARLGKHVHVDDLPGMLEGTTNERIVLIHVTRRTNMAQARQRLQAALPPQTLERVCFLMSRKYIEEE